LATEVTLQRHAAFDRITTGQPYEAAIDLVTQMAAYPSENRYMADIAGGNMHLLLFTMGWLLTDDQLHFFMTDVLKPKENELHRLIDSIYRLVNPLEEQEYYAYLSTLDELTYSENHYVAVVALYASSNPYISRDMHVGPENRRRMASEYPDLRATTSALRLPIFWLRNAPDRAAMLAQLGRRGEDWFPEAEDTKNLFRNDPLRTNAMELLPPLSSQNGSVYVAGVKRLGEVMNSADDWLDRYAYLRLLEPHVAPKEASRENRDVALAAVEKLSQKSFDEAGNVTVVTPDITRAWKIIAKDARRERDFEKAKRFVELLLTNQKRPVEPFERSLFEETMLDYSKYAERLKEMKQYSEAAEAFTRLANFYPNSAVQTKFLVEASDCMAEASR
jgi:tetratricopeptide (TPR) repeat protein